jgi:DNA-binding response OmpR family regulator
MKILYIEDEQYIAQAVAQVLRKNNFQVDLAEDGEVGLDKGLGGTYDLIILDLLLPKLDGWQVLRELRLSDINTPVLLLSARDRLEDKIKCLDLGADDYLTKPYHSGELLARVRALSRRQALILPNGIISHNDLALNTQTLMLECQGKSDKLTLKEELLMELLLRRHDMIVSKDIIIEKLYGYDADVVNNDNLVEIHIYNLRKKIANLQSNCFISTMRGLGYLLRTKE